MKAGLLVVTGTFSMNGTVKRLTRGRTLNVNIKHYSFKGYDEGEEQLERLDIEKIHRCCECIQKPV